MKKTISIYDNTGGLIHGPIRYDSIQISKKDEGFVTVCITKTKDKNTTKVAKFTHIINKQLFGYLNLTEIDE